MFRGSGITSTPATNGSSRSSRARNAQSARYLRARAASEKTSGAPLAQRSPAAMRAFAATITQTPRSVTVRTAARSAARHDGAKYLRRESAVGGVGGVGGESVAGER